MTDSVKNILGYDCFKAIAPYRGRRWTAWFAPEIPVQDGPWKLCGLPGLILEAYDTNHEYSFTATGLWQNGIPDVGYMAYDDKRGVRKQHRNKYFNDWWRYKNSNFGAKMNALYGNGKMPEKKDTAPKYDLEETNYPHDFDMGGNVSEWVQDWYGHYSEKTQRNPHGAKKSDIGKIFRGGSWNVIPDYNNPGCRFVSNPNFKCSSIGFRLAE